MTHLKEESEICVGFVGWDFAFFLEMIHGFGQGIAQ